MADRIFSAAALLFAGIFFYESAGFAEKNATQTFSSAFFPRTILVIMTVFALALLVQSFMKKDRKPEHSFSGLLAFFRLHWRVPAVTVLFVLYLYFMPLAGFLWSTVSFLLLGFLLLQHTFVTKRLLVFVPLSLGFTFAIHFIFERQLHILLP
ncbi:tripartite tricarboxylate transporter TctB family protein [Paenibacillus sp. TRM 82003]|nr:tripartite tricarboxylate transporter TctB family protein [Paenibacillus sp. TRM 82003]